jgi:hypothetical protein
MEIKINTDKLQPVGENLLATIQDGKLILVIDTTQEIGLSSTGKMMGIASTGGFTALPGGLKGNVYVGKRA